MENLAKEFETLSTNDPDSRQVVSMNFPPPRQTATLFTQYHCKHYALTRLIKEAMVLIATPALANLIEN
ncbi:hypothetical protein ACU8KH_05498 [Lachancea thermotolerans]